MLCCGSIASHRIEHDKIYLFVQLGHSYSQLKNGFKVNVIQYLAGSIDHCVQDVLCEKTDVEYLLHFLERKFKQRISRADK